MGTPTESEKLLAQALEVIERQRSALASPNAQQQQAPVAVTMNSPPQDLGSIREKLVNHELRIEILEGQHEKTENKSYSDLQDELKRYKDSSSHWTRYAITAVVTLFTGGLLLWLGKLLGKG